MPDSATLTAAPLEPPTSIVALRPPVPPGLKLTDTVHSAAGCRVAPAHVPPASGNSDACPPDTRSVPIVVGSTPELVTVNDRADELLPTVTEPKSMVVGSADELAVDGRGGEVGDGRRGVPRVLLLGDGEGGAAGSGRRRREGDLHDARGADVDDPAGRRRWCRPT